MQRLELDEKIKNKLKECVGQELKYSVLCQKTGLQVKSGASKMAQLNDLASYCDIVKLEKPTRFLIKEVYDVAFDVFTQISTNDNFQITFDSALFQALLNNNDYPLYVSGLELVEMFQEVNKNFAFTFSKSDLSELNLNYSYMNDMSEIVYRILLQWTNRKIESMNKRDIIRLGVGYRVYTSHVNESGQKYLMKHDVPMSTPEKISELDILCNKIYMDAVESILPKREVLNKETNQVEIKPFYPPYIFSAFENRLNKDIAEATDGKYCKLKRVNVILPPYSEWLKNKLKEIYKERPNLESINQEACRKVLETTQLDKYTNEERRKFILFNMTKNPPFSFRDKLEEKRKRKNNEIE